MSELTGEKIEDAFARIREKFEKRNNETGMEILDSYEEQWEATGSLSDRQLGWVERQLDGSWRPSVRPSVETDEAPNAIPELKPDVDEIPSAVQGPGQLLDAMIRQRLVEQGKAIVDFNRLNKLEEVIDELKRTIQSLK